VQITITPAAQAHFGVLLAKEQISGMNLRIFVANPGTIHAEVSLTFCALGEQEAGDIALDFENFIVFIEGASKEALTEAHIDFKMDAIGGQLSIQAPYLKGREPSKDTPLWDRVQYVIDASINPNLAGHGGRVSLIETLDSTEGKILILQFGGGCHGCGMAGLTLKHGIEQTLKENFPEIIEIRDATDHTTGVDPYY
jgi:Fe/S biogenesis protein NfuA